MATIPVAATEIGAWNVTLVAATADVVNFDRECDEIRVTNVDGAAAINFRVGSTSPTGVTDKAGWWIPAVVGAYRTVRTGGAKTTVRILSDGTPKYSVEGSL